MKSTIVVALSLAAMASADVPSLTPENYDSLTAGKTVFIKFFAPWCGHCKNMAPDWAKLSDAWAEKKDALVADVDCTSEGKPLCDANGVRGFPTLKWGDPASLEDYNGGRDYSSLSKFAEENLKPICSPSNIDLCDDEKKGQIKKLQAMDASDLDNAIKEEEKKLDDAEENFKAEVQKLQDNYQKLMSDKEDKIAEVKASGLGLMKAVKGAAEKSDKKDEL